MNTNLEALHGTTLHIRYRTKIGDYKVFIPGVVCGANDQPLCATDDSLPIALIKLAMHLQQYPTIRPEEPSEHHETP